MKRLILLSILLIQVTLSFAQERTDTLINKNEEIMEIGYHSTGTESGGLITMTITRSIIRYQEDNQPNKIEKNNDKNWFRLLSVINLPEFDRIICAEGISETDGIDTEFYIKTSKKKYSKLINSTNYKTISVFLNNVLKEAKHFNKDFNVNYYH